MGCSVRRVIFLALALIFQTAAGGIGLAAAQGGDAASNAVFCESGSASESSNPAQHKSHEHHCPECQLCATGASVLAAAPQSTNRDFFRFRSRAGFKISVPAPRRLLIERAHQARAPPSSDI
jgi:hypothetical protein